MRIRLPALGATLLLLSAAGTSLAAQRDTARVHTAPRTAREAMRRFVHALAVPLDEDPLSFFPHEGEWTWVHTTANVPAGGDAVGIWRFRASETEGATLHCGPARDSFSGSMEGQAPGLTAEASNGEPTFREVAPHWFVPPYQKGRYPTFVQWRKENGRWVIASFGDEGEFAPWPPPVDERAIVQRVRTRPEPATPAYPAANEPWFTSDHILTFAWHRYVAYGQPREIRLDELEPLGWAGDIRVYAEKGKARFRAPAVLYVPVSAGNYQPFVTYVPDECLP